MFKKFKNLFDNNKIFELLKNKHSILWLKLRAISRKELLNKFDKRKILNNPISFKYKFRGNEIFNVYSDCIFVVRK